MDFVYQFCNNNKKESTKNLHEEGLLHAHQYCSHHVFESVTYTQWVDGSFLVLVSIYIRYCICFLSLSHIQTLPAVTWPILHRSHYPIRKQRTFSDLKIPWIDRRIILRSKAWPKHVRNYFNCFEMTIAGAAADCWGYKTIGRPICIWELFQEKKNKSINCKQYRSNFES